MDSIIHSTRPKSSQDSYAYKIPHLTCNATSEVGSVPFSCDKLATILGYMDADYTQKIKLNSNISMVHQDVEHPVEMVALHTTINPNIKITAFNHKPGNVTCLNSCISSFMPAENYSATITLDRVSGENPPVPLG